MSVLTAARLSSPKSRRRYLKKIRSVLKVVIFSDFAEEYKKIKSEARAIQSVEARVKHLAKHFKDTPLSKITPEMVEEYKQKRLRAKVKAPDGAPERTLKGSSVNRELATLKNMFNVALKQRRLRGEWEKKVKYFVYDDPYPFRSEYAFDRTAFESTYAFAKYGATHDMAPDKDLWFDVKKNAWHSHPVVRRRDSRDFMDRQLYAGLSVRGWLDAAYYTLGSDPGVSYMAAMGGWGVLDFALNFAPRPFDWLQLGYASYLSSWCLMNTGRPETNYGFWFPGPENDGASGWQFMAAKAGSAWMGSSYPGGVIVPRGPWRYDGEIDLGYGGALRMAATVVARDPVFGWIAYGGRLEEKPEEVAVEPRDGVRRRLAAIVPGTDAGGDPVRLKVELERDGFAYGRPIRIDRSLGRVAFAVENRTADAHRTAIRVSGPAGSSFELVLDGRSVPFAPTGDWDYPWRAEIEVNGPAVPVEIVRNAGRPERQAAPRR